MSCTAIAAMTAGLRCFGDSCQTAGQDMNPVYGEARARSLSRPRGGPLHRLVRAAATTSLVLLQLSCGLNHRPTTPVVSGPTELAVSREGTFRVLSTDQEEDAIRYRITWCDGDPADSTGLHPSGAAVSVSHSWPAPGMYVVRAQAVDARGAESDWSDALAVAVTEPVQPHPYPDSLALVVRTGGYPFGICLSTDGNHAYVPVRGDQTVVIKTADNTVAARLATPGYAAFAAAAPDGRHVYVTARDAGCIYVIRTSDNTVTDTIAGIAQAWGIAITPDGEYAWVTQYGLGTVSVIRLSDGAVAGEVPVGAHPWGVCIGPDGEYAYVAGRETGRVYVIRTSSRTLHTSVTVPTGPVGIACTPDGRSVWVASGVGGSVSRISTADHTLREVLNVGGHPSGVAVTFDGGYVFAACYASGALKVISTATNSVVDDLYCGGENPDYIAFTPDFERAYVTQGSADGVMVFTVSVRPR